MIIAVTGSQKNVGDFLIAARSIQLLKKYVDEEIVEMKFQEMEEQKLEFMNSARAIILCGGPSIAKNMVPEIYPLFFNKLVPPIFPLGPGWSGKPIGKPEEFEMGEGTLEFLEGVHGEIEHSSCRDILTESILMDNGFQTLMTGCPAWYDLESINEKFEFREEIRSLVFSTPAVIDWNSISLMRAIAKSFPGARKICSFHRGIRPDRYTPLRIGIKYSIVSFLAKMMGYEVVDTSYNLEKIDFYKTCDFHIGYRVHAHLFFLARRLPSILICEDGRGVGQSKTLGSNVILSGDNNLKQKVMLEISHYYDSQGESQRNAIDKMMANFPLMLGYLEMIRSIVFPTSIVHGE